MNHHALQNVIYQPLDPATQEIRLLQFEEADPSPLSIVNRFTRNNAKFGHFLEGRNPSLRHPNNPLRCKLVTYELRKAPPYSALSYTWGDAARAGTIEIDDQSVPVGLNLLKAMQRLRQDYYLNYFWADAVCIDQKNNDEKIHQVGLMNQIYGRAEMVYVWLGEELSLTSQAFSVIQKFFELKADFETLIEKMNQGNDARDGPEMLSTWTQWASDIVKALDTEPYQRAMQQLLNNPYWYRVWILQEVAHANHAMIVNGRHNIELAKILGALYVWELARNTTLQIKGYHPFEAFGFSALYSLRTIVFGFPHHPMQSLAISPELQVYTKMFYPAHTDIFRLLVKTRSYKATDQRDKIYALLNLLRSEDMLLKPDYHRSEEELYRDLVLAGIKQYNSLCWISMGGTGVYAGSRPCRLPSWVPEFEKIGNVQIPYCKPIFMIGPGDRSPLSSCGSQPPEYGVCCKDENILKIKGFICDEIKVSVHAVEINGSDGKLSFPAIAKTLRTYNVRQGSQTRIYKELFHTLLPRELTDKGEHRAKHYVDDILHSRRALVSAMMIFLGEISSEHYFDAKLRKLDAERKQKGLKILPLVDKLELVLAEGDPALSYSTVAAVASNVGGTTQRKMEAVCEALYLQAANAYGDEYLDEVPLPVWKECSHESLDVMCRKFSYSVGSSWPERSFVITKSGLMGFARRGTRVGDQVCILYGCPSPLVIHPDGGDHVIVGDCFITGMMHGEMIKKQEEGAFVVEDLRFR